MQCRGHGNIVALSDIGLIVTISINGLICFLCNHLMDMIYYIGT